MALGLSLIFYKKEVIRNYRKISFNLIIYFKIKDVSKGNYFYIQ
jgi:hypothetical protein